MRKKFEDDFEDVPVRSGAAEDDFEEVSVRHGGVEDDFEEVPVRSGGVEDDFEEVPVRSGGMENDFEEVPVRSGRGGDGLEEISATPDKPEESGFGAVTENYLDHLYEGYEESGEEDTLTDNPIAEEIRARAERDETEEEREERRRGDEESPQRDRKRFKAEVDVEENPEDGVRRDRSIKGRLIALGIAGVAVLGICVFGVSALVKNQQKITYYREHFLPNTTINGVNCGDMTIDEAKDALAEEVSAYSLTITGRSDDVVLDADTGGMEMNFSVDLQDLLDQQDHSAYKEAEETPSNYTITTAVTLDEEGLRSAVADLEMFSNMTSSSDCSVTYDENTGLYVLKEAVLGTKVSVNAVADRVVECYSTLEKTLDLETEGFYEEVLEATDTMRTAVSNMNTYLSADVELTFGDAGSEKLEQETIQSCLTLDEEYNLTYDNTPLAEWVASLADKYDTYGKSHSFTTTAGSTISISGGTYGWKINQESTLEAVEEAVTSGSSVSQDPIYSQTAASHVGNDVGSTYIEVNLSSQMMYYYQSGSCLLSSSVVSGSVAAGNMTPTGVYSIYNMEKDRTLTGEGYSQKVSYWMPFYGGYGFHDASWRSSFGGTIYLASGSHGCVNLPSSVAGKLYGYISVGTPVVLYGGETSYKTSDTSTAASTTTTKETTTTAEESEEETSAGEEETSADEEETTTTAEQTTTAAPTTTPEETTTTAAPTTTPEETTTTAAPTTTPEETTTTAAPTTTAEPTTTAADSGTEDSGE